MAILRAMVVGQRFFKLQAAETKDNKTRMLLSTFISVPVDTLTYWLQHGGEDPESVLSEESAVEKLRRYEFEELAHTAEGLAKTFGAEIEAAHPMSADTPTASDFTRHELAMKLVGERHAKYELVDLVNWLLGCRERELPAAVTRSVLEALAQYRNDMLVDIPITQAERERRVEMIETTAALIPGGAEFMNPPHEKAA